VVPQQAAIPVFKPKLAQGAPRVAPDGHPKVPSIPVFKPDPALGRQHPFLGATIRRSACASIVGAVEEGRRVFANIKKYLMYLLSANLGEIGLLLAASLAGYPLPLTAVLILT
jgi:hypothetical protein